MDAMERAFRAGIAVVAGTALAPRAGALMKIGALLSPCCLSVVFFLFFEGLVPPLLSVIIESTAFVVATTIAFEATRHREAFVRSRFEQHLAPAVVRRILERPSTLKLRGELREVTALFTDVEGFTAMTRHIDPAILVNALDNYFEGMTTIITAHGGMIDKIVGDAVHALFNAPNDLNDHPQKAVRCAIALRSWSETFRHRTEATTIGFGRTRIGLETGLAIVGDVGVRTKLDYTAHGDAVNVAARLEAANKMLGSSICIGPVAASRCDQSLVRPLGKIIVRGRGDAMMVFEPRSSDTPISWELSEQPLIASDEEPIIAIARFDPNRSSRLRHLFTTRLGALSFIPRLKHSCQLRQRKKSQQIDVLAPHGTLRGLEVAVCTAYSSCSRTWIAVRDTPSRTQ
jgi:adenylate cyclase